MDRAPTMRTLRSAGMSGAGGRQDRRPPRRLRKASPSRRRIDQPSAGAMTPLRLLHLDNLAAAAGTRCRLQRALTESRDFRSRPLISVQVDHHDVTTI